MKKKLLAMLLCGCMAFTACGNAKEDETDAATTKDENSGALMDAIFESENKTDDKGADKEEDTSKENSSGSADTAVEGAYWEPQGKVELGKYIGIEVEKVEIEVTDAEIQAEIEYFLEYQSELKEITDRDTVQEGDVLKMDYKLVIDGEEVEANEGYDVEIGSGEFVEIEEKLLGLTVGTTQEIVTTMEDAANYEAYLGMEGTWTITLQAIQERVTPELTDELVAENTDYETVADYQQGLYNELYASKEADAQNVQIASIFNVIIENSTFTGLSDADVQSYVDTLVSSYEEYATMYGLDMDTFVTVFLGVSYEEFLEMAEKDGEYAVRQNLILEAVQEAEKLELTEQEYTDGLAAYAADYGYDSPEEFEEAAGKNEIQESLLRDKVLEFIIDSAVLK